MDESHSGALDRASYSTQHACAPTHMQIKECYLALIQYLRVPFDTADLEPDRIPPSVLVYMSKTREAAREQLPALLKVIGDLMLATWKSKSKVGDECCSLYIGLIEFAVATGTHPYCANAKCEYYFGFRALPKGEAFKKCGGCTNARYCSIECQKMCVQLSVGSAVGCSHVRSGIARPTRRSVAGI